MPHFLTIALDVTSASSADPGRTLSLPFWRCLALLFVLLLVLAALRPLSVPDEGEEGAKVALIAAKLGKTRLIDNLEW